MSSLACGHCPTTNSKNSLSSKWTILPWITKYDAKPAAAGFVFLDAALICHVKYVLLKDRNENKVTLERKDNGEKYQIKTNNAQDMDNLVSTLNMEQRKI